MKRNLKLGDKVKVITGSEKGKISTVLGFYKQDLVYVKNLNMKYRFVNKFDNMEKKTKKVMIFREGHIHISNLKKIEE